MFFIISLAGPSILLWQYAVRRTAAGRLVTVIAAALAVLGFVSIPGAAAFRIQSLFSKQSIPGNTPRVEFDSSAKWLTRTVVENGRGVRVELPLNISALPGGVIVKPEGFSLRLQAADGTAWSTSEVLPGFQSGMGQKFLLQFTLNDALYRKLKDEPQSIRGSLDLTLFGDRQSTRIPLGEQPVPVPRVGACSASTAANRSYFLICSSGFRFPGLLVSYRFIQPAADPTEDSSASTQPRAISYSPFPAEAGINPVSQDFTFSTAPTPSTEARVDTIEPLAYIHRSFTIDNLRLSDYEVHPPSTVR